jgi:hypothetical protein
MKIRFYIALAVIFSALGFAFSSNFLVTQSANKVNPGSKCAMPDFRTAYRESKAVFVGEVVGEEKEGDTRVFELKVEKYWKGANSKRLRVYVYETARYQAWFEKGGRYLIYAGADADGKLRVGRCSRSRDADNSEDLKQLGKGKIPR